MYKVILNATLVVTLCATHAFAHESANHGATDKESVGYAVGVDIGNSLVHGKDLVDMDALMKGIQDAFAGKEPAVSTEEIEATMEHFEAASLENQRAAKKVAEAAFMEKNAQNEGVVTLDSGLQYKVLSEGDGKSPSDHDEVRAHYEGRLLSGEVFDSSYARGAPVTFPVGRVIPGWTEALQLMNVGDKWELYIPFALAYGEEGAPPVIPPFATLIFQVELLEILPHSHGGHGHPH